MSTHPGILLINFGEPETTDHDEVVGFLERIFMANAELEGPESVDAARARSAELARRRAPGLIVDYRRIGGSPLHRQAFAQAGALAAELRRRGRTIPVECGMQFTRPTISEALERLRDSGTECVSALPVYPLCGPSTTVAALRDVQQSLVEMGWSPDVREIAGWHRHPAYVRLRAAAVSETARAAGLDLADAAVELVFSAHGTPLDYVRKGSRYVRYVEDWCARLAQELGVARYTLGYQNHSNRGVEWTGPDVEAAVTRLAGERSDVVVDAVSFVHEQSETLGELDIDLRGAAEALGLRFHRVPVRHDADELPGVFADLVETSLGERAARMPLPGPCICRPGATVCLNA
jgi:ferrochelatase